MKYILSVSAVVFFSGCAGVHVGRDKMYGATGLLWDHHQCEAACVEKVSTDSGEKCMKFAEGMARVCLADVGKEVRAGTYTFKNPK